MCVLVTVVQTCALPICIVMTSRDYIYNRARRDLKQDAFPLLSEAQVVIDVRDISTDEKRQILYNHMKLGRQPKEFKTTIKGLLQGVDDHERFIPEVARRLDDPMFTKDFHSSKYALHHVHRCHGPPMSLTNATTSIMPRNYFFTRIRMTTLFERHTSN